MITEQDLQEAIAECKGQRNPSTNTCIKLAAFLIIQREMFSKEQEINPEPSYSFSSGETVEKNIINYYGNTDFSQKINGREQDEIWPVVDELMSVLQAINPRLYEAVMKKLDKI